MCFFAVQIFLQCFLSLSAHVCKREMLCCFIVCFKCFLNSVAEPHHFYAAPAPDPAPGKNFDAAPAPTLLYSKENFLKRT
jgi:hypothetical protein